jgi:c-di-GMP-binding flagellar brake protein YcgR
MANSEPEKIYVSKYNTALVRCPGCGRSQLYSVDQFKGVRYAIKVACSCKAVFHVKIDFRRKYRKEINLPGSYAPVSQAKRADWGRIVLKNLSMTGVGFVIHGNHHIIREDALVVKFTLDDRPRSEIEKPVIVRNVQGNYLGCEFQSLAAYEKALGFYLLT